MSPPGARSVTAAFGRGFVAVLANPGLLVPPFVLDAAGLLTALVTLAALLVPLGIALVSSISDLRFLTPAGVVDRMEHVARQVVANPLLLLPAFASALVLGTLLVLLAAASRAGTTAVLLAADGPAPPGAELEGYRVERARGRFFEAVRRFTGRVFWLLNLYGLVLLVLLLPPLLLVLGVALAAVRSHAAAPLLVLLFLLGLPIVFVLMVAAQLTTVAATRQLVRHDLTVLDAVGQGLSRLRCTPGRSLALLLLLLAAGTAVGLVFTFPSVAVSLLLPHLLRDARPVLVASEVTFTLARMMVSLAFSVVTSAAFVSLWEEEAVTPADEGPPIAFPGRSLPDRLEKSPIDADPIPDGDPFPEAALPYPIRTGGSVP